MVDAITGYVWGQSFRRLVWLMPIAFALHIAEEYIGGFPEWVTHVVGGSFNDIAFALNACFMAIMLALTAWTSQTKSPKPLFLLILWASANLFWDALFHVSTTVAFDRYSPGLVTATLLYIPISLLVATSVLQGSVLSAKAFSSAVGLGAGLFGLVVWYGLFHFAI